METKLNFQPAFELCISIAGLKTCLLFSGLDQYHRDQLFNWYNPFRVPPEPGMPMVTVTIESGDQYIPFADGQRWRVETSRTGNRILFVSHLEMGWFDLESETGSLTMRPTGNPENYLRVLYAWRCLNADALLLHSSGMIRNGRGYVFFGCSGSGKTTITRNSPDVEILSDDLVILKCIDTPSRSIVCIYGVPFRGEMIEAPRLNASAPLHGLYALNKAQQHFTERIPISEAVGRMAAVVPFVMPSAADAARVLGLCAEIVRRVPVRILHFRRDPGFWDVIDNE